MALAKWSREGVPGTGNRQTVRSCVVSPGKHSRGPGLRCGAVEGSGARAGRHQQPEQPHARFLGCRNEVPQTEGLALQQLRFLTALETRSLASGCGQARAAPRAPGRVLPGLFHLLALTGVSWLGVAPVRSHSVFCLCLHAASLSACIHISLMTWLDLVTSVKTLLANKAIF